MAESATPVAGSASAQLKSIQVLRAVAALGVLTLHVANEKVTLFGGGPGPFQNFLLGAAGVDLFFIISGFVMVYSSESLFGRADAPKIFFLRRLARIAPLYWAVTIAILALHLRGAWREAVGDLFAREPRRVVSVLAVSARRRPGVPGAPARLDAELRDVLLRGVRGRDLAAAAAGGARGDARVRRAGRCSAALSRCRCRSASGPTRSSGSSASAC